MLIAFHQEIVNLLALGDSLTNKVHNMSKHFSSSGTNRKNYDTMLQNHHYLPTNQLQQDLNGTRIAAKHKLFQSCLRAKRVMKEHCAMFQIEPFFTEDEWRSVNEFEAALRETSRLTTIFQNEEITQLSGRS